MPITVVSLPQTNIGFGTQINLHTDFVGPFVTGTTWRFEVHPHGDESNLGALCTAPLWPTDNHEIFLQIGGDPLALGQQTYFEGQVSLNTGDLVDLIYTLQSPTGTVIDSGATNSVKWDTDTSSSKLIAAPTGGLTTAEAQQLADVHNLVAPPFTTTGGTPLPIDIGDLIKRPALKLLGIDTTVYTLTGQGTLAIPSLLGFPTAFGLVMNVTSAPSGWGRKPGYVDSFNFRIAQFLLLMEAANGAGSMVVAEKRLHLEHETWIFPDTWADHVAYYIDPPCEVQVQFLTAFTP